MIQDERTSCPLTKIISVGPGGDIWAFFFQPPGRLMIGRAVDVFDAISFIVSGGQSVIARSIPAAWRMSSARTVICSVFPGQLMNVNVVVRGRQPRNGISAFGERSMAPSPMRQALMSAVSKNAGGLCLVCSVRRRMYDMSSRPSVIITTIAAPPVRSRFSPSVGMNMCDSMLWPSFRYLATVSVHAFRLSWFMMSLGPLMRLGYFLVLSGMLPPCRV